MKKSRLGALVAAAALTLTFAGTAFAADLAWTGQGVTNGQVDSEKCDDVDPGELLWIFTDGTATDVYVTVDGNQVGTAVDVGGSWHITTPWLDPLDPNAFDVVVHYTGGDAKNPQFVLSHGCPAEETTTTTTEETTTEETTTEETTTEETTTEETTTEETTTEETTEETTTDETTEETTTEETTSEETTPSGSVEELTPPQTDTIGQSASSSSVSTGLLLVLAGILAAVLVVVPAAARSRR